MKVIEFEHNSSSMRYEYHRVREGPNRFITYYKNSSRLILDPKDAWRTLGVAKFTDVGKALKDWCLLMDETYGVPQREGWSTHNTREEGRVDTSFASEAMEELAPNDETKMVT